MHDVAMMLFRAGALLGHAAVTVWLFNRLHAMGWRRRVVKTLEKLLLLAAIFVVSWLCISEPAAALTTYAVVCCAALLVAIPYWLLPKLREKATAALVCNDTTTID